MIIGFDAKRAFANFTGLGNYSRYVLHALSKHFPDNQYLLYSPKPSNHPKVAELLAYDQITAKFPSGWKARLSSLWRTKSITKDLLRDGVQLYHGLSNEIPIGLRKKKIPSVVTIHDVIFLRYPQFYKAPDRVIYKWKFGYACRKADHVVAVSECTKRDIVTYFGIDPDKISVIYQGCDPSFEQKVSSEEKKAIRDKYQLPETFVLNVGTIESRKNLLLIVKALAFLDAKIHLVAIGRSTPYTDEVKRYIETHGLTGRVHFLSGVPFADLPALYQSAMSFVYPSFFEGFGIPIVEALHSEIPVIAATGSCLEEAGGPHSIYVGPTDAEGLAKAIDRVAKDSNLQASMISEGKKYAAKFDDRILATQTIELYQTIISRPF